MGRATGIGLIFDTYSLVFCKTKPDFINWGLPGSKWYGIIKTMKDFYTQKAAEMFDVPEADVTPEMRKEAKAEWFAKYYQGSAEKLKEILDGCPDF